MPPATLAPSVTDEPSLSGLAREQRHLAELGPRLWRGALASGVGALLLGLVLGIVEGDGLRRFGFAYLVAFAFVLSLALGALFWVTLQHLVNARWSVALRRLGELLAATLPCLAWLALPLVLPVVFGDGQLYPWAETGWFLVHPQLAARATYLDPGFFAARSVAYFGFWSGTSWWLLRRSLAQDLTGSDGALARVRRFSAPIMIGFAITTTFAATDFLMTLDPAWHSTAFGLYYFSGCVVAVHAALALMVVFLQSRGRLTRSITPHHLHDLGKMLFAFTVFWAYLAFSQFLMIWYAGIPEETTWYRVRSEGAWFGVAVSLSLGHFLFPCLGLLSRRVKRHRLGLAFWSGWLLAFHYLDLYFLIMPALNPTTVPWHPLDPLCLVGLLGIAIASLIHRAQRCSLIAVGDPRLVESSAFENW